MVDIIFPDAPEDILHLALLALGDGVVVHALVHEGREHVHGLAHIGRHAQFPVAAVGDDVREDGVDAHAVALAHALAHDGGHVLRLHDAAAHGVVEVVVDVGHAVGQAHDVGLERAARLPGRVVEDADACLVAEVQAAAVALDAVDDAQALLIVPEADAGVDRVECALSRVAERRVAEVVPEADGLGEVLIEFERAGDRAREARDLERVRQARAVMVALRAQEHLRLVLQAAERFRVRDAVDVALEARAHLTRRLGRRAAGGLRAQQAVRADEQRLGGFAFFSRAGHRDPSVSTKNRCLRPEHLAPFPAAIFLYDIAVHFPLFFEKCREKNFKIEC